MGEGETRILRVGEEQVKQYRNQSRNKSESRIRSKSSKSKRVGVST